MAPAVMSAVWYAQMQLYLAKKAIPASQLRICWLSWWGTVAVAILVALLKVARYEAIPVVLGIVIVYLRTEGSGKSIFFSLKWGAVSAVGILALFSAFALLRGFEAFGSLMGYGPASFNHMTAMLEGRLQYGNQGSYTLGFLNHIPLMSRVFEHGLVTNFDNAIAFQQEFDRTEAAGLNHSLIWVTAPGYWYSDIGYWTILFLFFCGIVFGLSWKAFNDQRAWGSVMYPFLASTLLLWPTTPFMTRANLPTTVIAAVLLTVWNMLPIWKRKATLPSEERRPSGRSGERRVRSSRSGKERRRVAKTDG